MAKISQRKLFPAFSGERRKPSWRISWRWRFIVAGYGESSYVGESQWLMAMSISGNPS
jgi:hypothetical protein